MLINTRYVVLRPMILAFYYTAGGGRPLACLSLALARSLGLIPPRENYERKYARAA